MVALKTPIGEEAAATPEDSAPKTKRARSRTKDRAEAGVPLADAPLTPRRGKTRDGAAACPATPKLVVIEIPDSESDLTASPAQGGSPFKVVASPRPVPSSRRSTPRQRGTHRRARSSVVESGHDLADDVSDSGGGSGTEAALAAGDTGNAEAGDLSLLASATAPATDAQLTVFQAITRAVTTAPRSRDAARPSWHEKVLMYDPVVTEDLAAWLNEGQLDRVGFDSEVDADEVKRWCASKSVCCMGRATTRGKERKRV